MGLKADMRVILENTKYKSDAAIRPGSAVILKTTQPTGAGTGQVINYGSIVATNYTGAPPSGTVCVGVALNEVVDKSASDGWSRNQLRPSQQFIGENVLVGEIAEVWTDEITGTPAIGGDAFLAAGSTFGTATVNANPKVGKWMSLEDADGYALLLINVTVNVVS